MSCLPDIPCIYQTSFLLILPESPNLLGRIAYSNLASTAMSHAESSGNILSSQFNPPTGNVAYMQPIGSGLNGSISFTDNNCATGDHWNVSSTSLSMLNSEQNLRSQGLSLSLGTQISSAAQVPTVHNGHIGPDLSTFWSPHTVGSGHGFSRNDVLGNGMHVSFDLPKSTNYAIKVGSLNNLHCSIDHKEINSGLYDASGTVVAIVKSKYLKATQQLLEEVVNVHKAVMQPESGKTHSLHSFGIENIQGINKKYNSHSELTSNDPDPSTFDITSELSPEEQQDLRGKVTKLVSMLEEVDRRYRQYNYQVQITVSSFEMVTGREGAKPYTALAVYTISRQFRSLRNAINQQIQIARQKLGDIDATSNSEGGGISRLRYIDQKLRHQKALQQVGLMGHCWRPQRGLPENSVSTLRAWLFEHFLNPYPKDSEKLMLAKQTGLTRSQVANWFINARVRLWKPMVEDMYKEEFGDSEKGRKYSPDSESKLEDKSWHTEDTKELTERETLTATDGSIMRQSDDSNLMSEVKINGCTARLGLQNGVHGDEAIDCGTNKMQHDQRFVEVECNHCPDENIIDNGSLTAANAANTYDASDWDNFAVDDEVSLALGLKHSEKGGKELIGTATSSWEPGKAEYKYVEPMSQEHRFENSHLLSEFLE